ncbi:phosphate acetyltransferase [Leuconostoc pseudomesenteroides]|nr:phosphate acetyltransferase [Leuconostoc pseudomesenteroides]
MPNLNNDITKKTLYDLMADHQDKIAKLQFYDMADQYFLTIGDWSVKLSEKNATDLFSIFKDDEQATFSTFNQRQSLIVTQKRNPE